MEFFMLSNRDILKKILRRIREASYVEPEDIPSIDLYMDQVTTFMDEHLKNNKRHPSDKALTKTMINNYTKNRLLPAPVKKKYSKEHMLLLLFIYYFKNLLTFSDIENIFKPITNLHFSNKEKSGIDLEDIYKEIIRLNKPDVYELQKDMTVYLVVNNLTNKAYETSYSSYLRLGGAPGRNWMIGAR